MFIAGLGAALGDVLAGGFLRILRVPGNQSFKLALGISERSASAGRFALP